MNKIICYINDNYIDIKKDNHIYHILSNSIIDGNIVDSKKFINDIKKNRLFNNILSQSIDIYLNKNIYEETCVYFNFIFQELNCNKINIYNTKSKIDNNTLIDNGSKYILYKDDYYIFDKEMLLIYINYFKINNLKVITNKKLIPYNKCKYLYYNNYNEIMF